jgi:hypothetical protein
MLTQRKPKKQLMPWRQNILSHHKARPSAADRAEFPVKVILELKAEANGRCQCGCGKVDQETHHIYPRGRGGRGVKANGLRLHSECHTRIQSSEFELQLWIDKYREKYGNYFWFDEQDWEEHNRAHQRAQREYERRKRRMCAIKPVLDFFTEWAGRELKPTEVAVLDKMLVDDNHRIVFQKLLQEGRE